MYCSLIKPILNPISESRVQHSSIVTQRHSVRRNNISTCQHHKHFHSTRRYIEPLNKIESTLVNLELRPWGRHCRCRPPNQRTMPRLQSSLRPSREARRSAPASKRTDWSCHDASSAAKGLAFSLERRRRRPPPALCWAGEDEPRGSLGSFFSEDFFSPGTGGATRSFALVVSGSLDCT